MRRQENKDEEVRQKWGEWREEKGWRVWWRKGMRDWGEMWESKGGKHEKSRCHSSFVRIKWWDETGHERKKRREQFNHPLSSIYPSICVSIKQILSAPAVTRVFLTAHTHTHTHSFMRTIAFKDHLHQLMRYMYTQQNIRIYRLKSRVDTNDKAGINSWWCFIMFDYC